MVGIVLGHFSHCNFSTFCPRPTMVPDSFTQISLQQKSFLRPCNNNKSDNNNNINNNDNERMIQKIITVIIAIMIKIKVLEMIIEINVMIEINLFFSLKHF